MTELWFTPEASAQTKHEDQRWREFADYPDLFADELAAATAKVQRKPDLYKPYMRLDGEIVRRVLLPKTKVHIYYRILRERAAVEVISVWGAGRGKSPPALAR